MDTISNIGLFVINFVFKEIRNRPNPSSTLFQVSNFKNAKNSPFPHTTTKARGRLREWLDMNI